MKQQKLKDVGETTVHQTPITQRITIVIHSVFFFS